MNKRKSRPCTKEMNSKIGLACDKVVSFILNKFTVKKIFHEFNIAIYCRNDPFIVETSDVYPVSATMSSLLVHI